MKILTVNFGGIGDEIFFLPTLISLKKEFPNAEITLALEPRSQSVKELTDVIDNILLVDIKGKRKYRELLKFLILAMFGGYDMVISSGSNKFISILLWLTGIKKRYGYDTGKLSHIFLTKTVPLNKNQYACAMYHDLIAPITDIKTYLPEINVKPQQKIPNSVLIHPGVSKISFQKEIIKTIPPQTWAEIIDMLLSRGVNVMLAGGPDDDECIRKIWKLANIKSSLFTNYYPKTKSLRDLAELIGKAEKFICSDSAPLHIAVAMKTRTYAIFGPTDDKKLIPQSDLVTPIKAKDDCPIKPCLWEQRQTTCEDLKCLNISAYDVEKLMYYNH